MQYILIPNPSYSDQAYDLSQGLTGKLIGIDIHTFDEIDQTENATHLFIIDPKGSYSLELEMQRHPRTRILYITNENTDVRVATPDWVFIRRTSDFSGAALIEIAKRVTNDKEWTKFRRDLMNR